MPFIHQDLQKSKRCIIGYCHILAVLLTWYQIMLIGLNIFPSIWQSCINAILDCLQSRKYCEASMDDLLLFTPDKKCHEEKLGGLSKTLLKNRLKILSKKCILFKKELQYMGNTIICKRKEGMCKTHKNKDQGNSKNKNPYYT